MTCYVEMFCIRRILTCSTITIHTFLSSAPLPADYSFATFSPLNRSLWRMLLCSPPLQRLLGSVPQGRLQARQGGLQPPWLHVLVPQPSLERRLWPFPGSLRRGDREGYVQIIQSLQRAEAMGPEGRLIMKSTQFNFLGDNSKQGSQLHS